MAVLRCAVCDRVAAARHLPLAQSGGERAWRWGGGSGRCGARQPFTPAHASSGGGQQGRSGAEDEVVVSAAECAGVLL